MPQGSQFSDGFAHLSRRLFLMGAAAMAVGTVAKGDVLPPILATPRQNPLIRQRADAQIFRHSDGQYYMTGSVPEYDRLVLRRAATLSGLSDDGAEVVVWRRPPAGPMGGYIWAPELHWFDGAWHLYFAAGDGGEPFHIRTYVLSCRDVDPLTGVWSLTGQLETPWDSFTLDSTIFDHLGQRYICWAQAEPGIKTNSNLYLAPLASPTRLAREPLRLTVPTLDWETQKYKVAEAPAILSRNGRLFITYSASATDARYCLGMLTASADADIMAAESWTKSPHPVFVSSPETSVYGPGHNSFTVDEQGRDILVYHGRDYRDIQGNSLFDPNRHTRIQRFYFDADGVPDFGVPVGNGALPDRYSPQSQPGRFLSHTGDRLLLGNPALAMTQFRAVPVGLGAESVLLSPILRRDLAVQVAPDGTAGLAPLGAATAFVRRNVASGLVSLRLPGRPGLALCAVGETIRAAPVDSGATPWRID